MLVLATAALGLFFARPFSSRAPLYALLLVYTIGVGLTWTTFGRFRIPMMPLLFALAADGLVAAARRAGLLRSPPGSAESES
jgi:hypothetical protein